MSTLTTHEELGIRIEDALRRRFTERSTAAESYGAAFTELWNAAAAHALGGKLIRPRLLLEVHSGLALSTGVSPDSESALDVAANVELLHYAFLLHDDVIDGDLVRRRRPNLIGSLARTGGDEPDDTDLHWARSSAILMGDLLLSTALLGFARARVSTAARLRLLDLIEHTILETVAGEHADVSLGDGRIAPDLQTILAMSSYKTATYSFSLPLRAAAVLAGVSTEVENDLSTIGMHLGLAFQLQDDLLCIFGDSQQHGKDAFSDLREGKETALISYARMTTAWSHIEPHFGSGALSDGDALGVRDRLRACGAERFVRSLVAEELAAAASILSAAEATRTIPAEASTSIRALLARIEERDA